MPSIDRDRLLDWLDARTHSARPVPATAWYTLADRVRAGEFDAIPSTLTLDGGEDGG